MLTDQTVDMPLLRVGRAVDLHETLLAEPCKHAPDLLLGASDHPPDLVDGPLGAVVHHADDTGLQHTHRGS